MTDWADEIEKTIAAVYSSHGAILAADADGMIAAALRKARKEGLLEVSAVVKSCLGDQGTLLEIYLDIQDIIKKGTP